MSKPLSVLIDRLVPQFIRDEYSKFTDFIRKYLEFTEQTGNVQDVLSDFLRLIDLDQLNYDDPYSYDAELIELAIQQYLSSFPLYRVQDIDLKKLLKNSKDFYSCKGTEQSYQFLFKLMNRMGSFSFYYPDQDIVTLNDTVNGLLSEEKALHDNYYRAFYTYEIRSDEYGYAELKEIIENVLHPVGCKVFFLRTVISEGDIDPNQVPTDEMHFVFVLSFDTSEWENYLQNQIIYDGVTFEDIENGNAGILSLMDFEDWGDTFANLENPGVSHYPHQLHVYRTLL